MLASVFHKGKQVWQVEKVIINEPPKKYGPSKYNFHSLVFHKYKAILLGYPFAATHTANICTKCVKQMGRMDELNKWATTRIRWMS